MVILRQEPNRPVAMSRVALGPCSPHETVVPVFSGLGAAEPERDTDALPGHSAATGSVEEDGLELFHLRTCLGEQCQGGGDVLVVDFRFIGVERQRTGAQAGHDPDGLRGPEHRGVRGSGAALRGVGVAFGDTEEAGVLAPRAIPGALGGWALAGEFVFGHDSTLTIQRIVVNSVLKNGCSPCRAHAGARTTSTVPGNSAANWRRLCLTAAVP